MTIPRRTLILAAASLPLAAHAQSVDMAGVKFEPEISLGGSTLRLNGAGIRYKAVFKVYAAGLYLTRKATTTDDVLATPGPKRMRVTMLRDIDANELGKLLTKGVEDNSPREEMAKFLPGLLKLGEMFAARKKLLAGQTFTVDFLPGAGTLISVEGEPVITPVKEVAFFNALMRIWLGHAPPDFKLKDALLSGR